MTFARLSKEIADAGLMGRRPGYYTARITTVGALYTGGWVAFVLIGASWWTLAVAVLLALVFGQVALLAHDVAHRQVFRLRKGSERFGRIAGNAGAVADSPTSRWAVSTTRSNTTWSPACPPPTPRRPPHRPPLLRGTRRPLSRDRPHRLLPASPHKPPPGRYPHPRRAPPWQSAVAGRRTSAPTAAADPCTAET